MCRAKKQSILEWPKLSGLRGNFIQWSHLITSQDKDLPVEVTPSAARQMVINCSFWINWLESSFFDTVLFLSLASTAFWVESGESGATFNSKGVRCFISASISEFKLLSDTRQLMDNTKLDIMQAVYDSLLGLIGLILGHDLIYNTSPLRELSLVNDLCNWPC